MTQVYTDNGVAVPVTVLKAGPCVVTQVKTVDGEGYRSFQIGYGTKKEKNMTKPEKGHLKGNGNFAILREFRFDEEVSHEVGQQLNVDQFEVGEKVKVTGTSKGKGFQGVVKRHGFSGAPASHGHKDQQRMPGSIGATGPQKVFKGTKMGGQMGNVRSTVTNLEVVKVDTENNEIYVKGAVPGARNSYIYISA